MKTSFYLVLSIISCYQHEAYIKIIINQTYKNIKWIALDDGSYY
ncbi:MAG: glycosyltransferase family A protein [Acinetobacter harbinensis]|nr:glycosyltransferase family A protein [Acinetobacter harbinensis]